MTSALDGTNPSPTPLSHDEILRYSRHLILPEVGVAGQQRLRAARVLIVGAGGLGSPSAIYLAAAGVGTLGLVDFDTVDVSNLQRQPLHGTSAVGRPKLESARQRLADLNPHVQIVTHDVQLSSDNARDIVARYDLVVDGSDNFPTRYLVNDATILERKPYVYGAIFRFEGQVSVFGVDGGPCYRCLFREPPPPGVVPSCAEAGVLGVLPGIIGTLQALEAIKLLLREGRTLAGRLVLFDALRLEFRELEVHRDPTCPICGDAPTITDLIDYEQFCGTGPLTAAAQNEVSVSALAAELDRGANVVVVDVREPGEWAICHLDGAVLVPLGRLPEQLDTLDSEKPIVTMCHTGVRSLRALEILRSAGFRDVRNLTGGIDAWAREVDPAMARY